MPFRKRKYLGKTKYLGNTKYLGKNLMCGSVGLKEPVGRTGRKMVQNLSELREQLCSNGRCLKAHPASPRVEHKPMCLGNGHIHSPLSLQFHPPVPACGWGPAAPAVWFGHCCQESTSALKNHPQPCQGPDQPSLCWAPSPRQGCPGTKRGGRAPTRLFGGSEPCKCGEVYKINSYLSGQWVKSEPSFNELCG